METSLQDSSGNTVDSSSPLVDTDNLGADVPQESPGNGVCLAIGGDGNLYRLQCSTQLPAFCYSQLQGKLVTWHSIEHSIGPGIGTW